MDKNLENLLYFTNEDLIKFTTPINNYVYLNRRIKSGEVLRLKRGIYVSQSKINELQRVGSFDTYLNYLATNILISPSYLSLEGVLFSLNIIIENVYTTTAITTKNHSNIQNKFGRFEYRNISQELFRGYETKKKD